MDNIITGAIGMAMFMAFIGGLAESIGALPFIVIVVAISAMALYDYYENLRDARKEAADKAQSASLES